MEDSILNTTKRILGINEDDTSFDIDIITHINSAFSTLHQMGIGPVGGFSITDETSTWAEFLDGDIRFNAVKTYVYMKVRMVFDPPTTAHLLSSMKEQMQELEVRLNLVREDDVAQTTVL